MSADRDLLADLDLIGARLEPAGDRLILRAGPMAVPSALVRRVREAKADLLATLAVSTDPTVLGSDRNREHIGKPPPDEGKHRTFEFLRRRVAKRASRFFHAGTVCMVWQS